MLGAVAQCEDGSNSGDPNVKAGDNLQLLDAPMRSAISPARKNRETLTIDVSCMPADNTLPSDPTSPRKCKLP